MTEMSEHLRVHPSQIARKAAGSWGGGRLARRVHDRGRRAVWIALPSLPVALGLAAGGCVIPPDLQVANQDASVNSPPAILSVRTDQEELAEPGPFAYPRGPGMLSLTVLDTDVDDTLFIRIFVDYTNADPTPPRSTCTAPSTDTPTRTATCDLGALCLTSDIGVERLMNIAVFDRPVLEVGTPAFRAMEAGGQTTSRTYKLSCTPP